MNAKTSIAVTLVVFGILLAGLASITGEPPTVVTIVIPSWLRAAGAVGVLSVVIFWLRANLYRAEPTMQRIGNWLEDDSAPLLADLLDRPATTGATTVLDADWYHGHESGVR